MDQIHQYVYLVHAAHGENTTYAVILNLLPSHLNPFFLGEQTSYWVRSVSSTDNGSMCPRDLAPASEIHHAHVQYITQRNVN